MTSPPRKLQRIDPWLNGLAMQVAKKRHGQIAQRRLRKNSAAKSERVGRQNPNELSGRSSTRNSNNCVARTIVYGTLPPLICLSWATLARTYPLSGKRSAPTTDGATWWPTPAAASAAMRLRPARP